MRVLFAGGGTGGHLVPGLNVADNLKTQNARSTVLFLTGKRPVEWRFLQERKKPFKEISSLQRFSWKKPWQIPVQGLQCLYFVRRFRPNISVGLGSYSSVIPMLSTRFQNIPFLLVEQNVVPGKATNFLAPFATAIACQWEETIPCLKGAGQKAFFSGPLLQGTREILPREEARAKLGLSRGAVTLMVMGGSQGALAVNRICLENISLLKSSPREVQVIHLTGPAEEEKARNAYKDAAIRAFVAPFYVDMPLLFSAADCILCRGGGTTLAEVTYHGLPAVIVPYPWHRDRHQYRNAEVLAKHGSACLVDEKEFTPKAFRESVLSILNDPRKRQAMRNASKGIFPLDGTERVIQKIKQLSRASKERLN